MIDFPGFAPTRRVEKIESGYLVHVKPPNMFGLPEVHVFLTDDQYRRFELWLGKKGLIQNLLPDLSDSKREMLITGLDDEEFHRFAGDDNDSTD